MAKKTKKKDELIGVPATLIIIMLTLLIFNFGFSFITMNQVKKIDAIITGISEDNHLMCEVQEKAMLKHCNAKCFEAFQLDNFLYECQENCILAISYKQFCRNPEVVEEETEEDKQKSSSGGGKRISLEVDIDE